MKTLALAMAAVLLPAFPAAAQNTVPATQYRQTANTDSNKLICESEEQIGSRLGKNRVCLTAEQWKEKHREHREFTDDIQAGTYARSSADPADSPMGHGPQ